MKFAVLLKYHHRFKCIKNNIFTLLILTCSHKFKLLLFITLIPLVTFTVNLNIESDDVLGVDVKELPSQYVIPQAKQANSWLDPWYCDVQCRTGVPCEYRDEVQLRIIVLTYHRKYSLQKCLDSISNLNTDGDKISVDIWIDRSQDGVVDYDTVVLAQDFHKSWSIELEKGRVCIHIQNENAFISGQWVNTWRPKKNTNELALILEDDISISPFAYKWLKATHAYFGRESNIAGYTLQMEDIHFFAPVHYNISEMKPMRADAGQRIFMYPVIGTWGYSPHPAAWRTFQDWYYTVRPHKDINTDNIKAYVPGIVPNVWYHNLVKIQSQESMWEMWHIKFTHDYHLFTVYANLKEFTGRKDVILSTNRKEIGLHFNGNSKVDNSKNLLNDWHHTYVDYKYDLSKWSDDGSNVVKFNYDGILCSKNCCFSRVCSDVIENIYRKSYWELLMLLVPFQSL